MASKKDLSLIEEVTEFIEDEENDDDAVELVSTLYQVLSSLAAENAGLELEVSLLSRQLNIAESYIAKLEKDKGPHLLS